MELDREMEQAAASLGASPVTTFRRIILPNLMPAVLSGAALVRQGRGRIRLDRPHLGEHLDTEVASVHIFKAIESDDQAAAAAVSVVLLFSRCSS